MVNSKYQPKFALQSYNNFFTLQNVLSKKGKNNRDFCVSLHKQ